MRKMRKLGIVSLLLAVMMLFSAMPAFGADTAGSKGVMEQLLQDVSPKGSVSVVSGQTLTLRALALAGSEVTASVQSSNITLSATGEEENGGMWYEGAYQVPSGSAGTSFGEILFTAKSGARSERRVGASLVIASKNITVEVENPDQAETPDWGGTPVSGDMVVVKPNYADIYSSVDRGEDYAAPYYYNLPKGTIDYVVGSTSASYILKSGRRIAKSNVTSLGSGSKGNNGINGVSVKNDGTFTTLVVNQSWNVPFNLTPTPLTYTSSSSNYVASCIPEAVVLTFDYTTSFVPSSITFPNGSAFTRATWEKTSNGDIPQIKLTLTLSQKGGYYGAYAKYNSAGALELQFLNPVSSLRGARVVVDPGHGTGDTGNAGSGYYESTLNLQKAQALKAELESRGATVYMLDSNGGSKKMELNTRVELATNWQPHVYISVHHNWADNTSARGVEVFYNNPYSQRLSKYINDNIFSAYQSMQYGGNAKNRGGKFSEFAVTRTKQFAAVLVEYGFLSNKEELSVCVDQKNNPAFARATADGLEKFFSGK